MTDWIEEAEAACEAATKGPWKWDQGDIGNDYSIPYCDVYTEDETIISNVNDSIGKEIGRKNAKFIALSRTALPRALKALKAADELAEHLEKLVQIEPHRARSKSLIAAYRKALE